MAPTTQEQALKDAVDLLDELRKENRAYRDELSELRPLARLAKLVSFQEGENSRQHDEIRKWDRDWEDVKEQYLRLKVRVEKLEAQMNLGKGRRRQDL